MRATPNIENFSPLLTHKSSIISEDEKSAEKVIRNIDTFRSGSEQPRQDEDSYLKLFEDNLAKLESPERLRGETGN